MIQILCHVLVKTTIIQFKLQCTLLVIGVLVTNSVLQVNHVRPIVKYGNLIVFHLIYNVSVSDLTQIRILG